MTQRPKAIATGKLHFGNRTIDCYVLEDGRRVVSQRGIVAGIFAKSSGKEMGNLGLYLGDLSNSFNTLAAEKGNKICPGLPIGTLRESSGAKVGSLERVLGDVPNEFNTLAVVQSCQSRRALARKGQPGPSFGSHIPRFEGFVGGPNGSAPRAKGTDKTPLGFALLAHAMVAECGNKQGLFSFGLRFCLTRAPVCDLEKMVVSALRSHELGRVREQKVTPR